MKLLPPVMKRLSGGHLGADSAAPRIILAFRVKDGNGTLIKESPFHIVVYPYPDCTDGCNIYDHRFSRDTDDKGVVEFDIPGSHGEVERVISLTPLFSSKWAEKDKAIIWKTPFLFKKEPTPIDIVLAPGAGLIKKPAEGASSLPVPKTPSGPAILPPSKVEEPSVFPWGPVLVGAAVLGAGIFLLPILIDKVKGGR